MSTFAIGDIQGCFASLEALLARVGFGPSDRVWLVGDLVNRGPGSLEVLRWARALHADGRLQAVLGNHDLHLLARARGLRARAKRDTLEEVLAAPDRDELLAWLGGLPLLVREGERLLVHAGLLPAWTPEEAERLAAAASARLRDDPEFLAARYRKPRPQGELQRAVDALTLMRCVDAEGRPDTRYKGGLEGVPAGLVPWFRAPGRRSLGVEVVCGHWAALGLHRADGVAALDTGCVWGGALTALRLEDGAVFQQPAAAGDA